MGNAAFFIRPARNGAESKALPGIPPAGRLHLLDFRAISPRQA